MDDRDKCKIDVRSILLPFQKGCYLSDFNREYFHILGKRLPYREMGFSTDIELLYSMPDVVKITPTGRNMYHLMGIADEKSKHIQKMVAKQKPAKLRVPPPSSRSTRSSRLPPRFARTQRIVYSNSKYQSFFKEPEIPPATLPKEEPELPKLEEPELPLSNESPMVQVIKLVEHFKNNLALDDLLCEYKRMYKKNLSLSTYGFSTIEECINEIEELEIFQTNNVNFVRLRPERHTDSNNNDGKDENLVRIPTPEAASSYNSEHQSEQNLNNGNIPLSLREKLLKVAGRITNGIFASDFLRYFEEETGQSLELANLGYRCLNDFIDDVPDIFLRKPVAGSKKDSFIYSVKDSMRGRKEIVDEQSALKFIILNLRRILVAYPEGITLRELPTVYSINCKDTFDVKDFGFDNLENFLSSIKNDVPLKFGSIVGLKSIHLVKVTEMADDSPSMAPEAYEKEAIPYDAVFPEFKYKPHTFPADFDFGLYIPAYTSSVTHAGRLYLQFQEENKVSDDLTKLGKEIDNFYNGNQSDQYIIKSIHIEVGACCIAKWPADNHWYRAQILSIPSMQNVRVYYVDYGTTDTIPKFLLRYAKKEFIELPVQAVRCRLAFLKPPKNAPKWDIQSRNRILELCQDIPLMAKIADIGPDGVHSVLLCDTNGSVDVHINDVLIEEGLAEGDARPTESDLPVPESKNHPEPLPYLHPLQALQAQYYLRAFAAVAPVYAQNEMYLSLLKEVTVLCQSSDTVSQGANIPFVTPVGPPGFNNFLPGLNSLANPAALYNGYPSATSAFGTTPIRKPKTTVISPPSDLYSTSVESPPTATLPSSPDFPDYSGGGDFENDEVFDDDDEEMFQQFCQKVSLTNVRFIKRAVLGDGYKIHIIIVDSQPYASSGEISQLIWNNKEADYLFTRLQLKEVSIPFVSLSEDGHEELFKQLLKFNVKGVQKTKGFKSSIVLYPLKDVMKILNIFGHPSIALRTRLTEEITSFNSNDRYWRENVEYSADLFESEDDDTLSSIVYSSATDDDKIEKLCLHDLYAMKESIVCKRKKMLSSSDLSKSSDEAAKLEQLLQKVLTRIQEIKEICQVFS